jgi:hypothetical protein
MSLVGQVFTTHMDGYDGLVELKYRVVRQVGVWLNLVLFERVSSNDDGTTTVTEIEQPRRGRKMRDCVSEEGIYNVVRILTGDKNERWYAMKFVENESVVSHMP